jgi:hypothetical protein
MSIPYRLHETRQQNIILGSIIFFIFNPANTAVDAGQQQQQLQIPILLKHYTKIGEVNKESKGDVTPITQLRQFENYINTCEIMYRK